MSLIHQYRKLLKVYDPAVHTFFFTFSRINTWKGVCRVRMITKYIYTRLQAVTTSRESVKEKKKTKMFIKNYFR